MAYHFVLLEMESCSVHANPIMKDHFVMNAGRASLIIQNVNVSTKYLLKADVETREHNYEVFKV